MFYTFSGHRAHEKIQKHLSDCATQGRTFLPWVITTFSGSGDTPFTQWLRSMTAAADLRLLSEGNDGTTIPHLIASFFEDVHAAMTRADYDMIVKHTRDRS